MVIYADFETTSRIILVFFIQVLFMYNPVCFNNEQQMKQIL